MRLSGQPVDLWKEWQIWSLLDMIRYAVGDLHCLLLWIERMVLHTHREERTRFGIYAALNEDERKTVANQISCIRKQLASLESTDSLAACDGFTDSLNSQRSSPMTLGECRGQLVGLREMLTDALRKRFFMYVPIRVAQFAKSNQAPVTIPAPSINPLSIRPLGDEVYEKFKDARFDAQQFALCIVAGASTAAVFHMMRVVEWGVRALGKDLGLRKIKDVYKPKPGGSLKTPKVKLTPIENATWEKIQGQLRNKVDKRLSRLRPGPAKDRKSAYYSSILEDFNGFKDAWRNHVMHTRLQCKDGEELRVLSYVDRFMKSLAEGCPVTARRA